MVKLIVLYTHPTDKETFDKHYFETHVPLVQKLQRMRKAEAARVTGAPRGESPYYLMTEMYWDSMDDLNADMMSDEMRAVGKDARQMAGDIMSMHIAEVVE